MQVAALFVSEESRHAGTGKALVRYVTVHVSAQEVCDLCCCCGSCALDFAWARDADHAYLWFPEREAARLQGFYESLGWVETEIIEYLGEPVVIGSFVFDVQTR